MESQQQPQRRVRRSSSRSPSLTRRPSLKDKPTSGISKPKKKGTGSKKERWLLTRKTWRYMSDAVGSLLPEHKDKTRSSSPLGPSTSRRPSSSLSTPVTPTTPGPISYGVVPAGHGYSTGSVPASHSYGFVTGMPQPWPLFSPITYQEGQGKRASTARSSICSSSGVVPSLEPDHDIPALEDHFDSACKKEKKFLLWTRTKAKGLSGPALHELKMKGERTRTSSSSSLAARPETPDTPRGQSDSGQKKSEDLLEYYSPEDEDLMDDYDEYEPDEEQMTVREFPQRKNSSGASSVVSMVSGGISFWRPPPTSSLQQPPTSSDSYYVITLGPGIQKYYRNTGVQTEPLPEEILIRLRLQSVREEQYQRQEAEKLEFSEVRDSAVVGAEYLPPDGHEVKGVVPSESSGGISTEDKKSEESGYSSSISDTVMRYLRMVRKNSKADTKETIDRFKTVNYDRSLRNIKSKNVTVEEALEHEKNKALAQQKGQTPTTGQESDLADARSGDIPSKSSKGPYSPTKNSKKDTPSTTPTKKKRAPSITNTNQSGLSGGTTTGAYNPGPATDAISSPEGPTPPLSPTLPEVPPPPSIGVQTAETLIRFLKSLNPIRKFSDLSSYGSSESPVDVTSPRYSIATGSDASDIYSQSVDDGLRHHPSSYYEHDFRKHRGGASELEENWSYHPQHPHSHRPSSSYTTTPSSHYASDKLKKSSSTIQMRPMGSGSPGPPYFYSHQDPMAPMSSSSTPSTPTIPSKPGHSEVGKSSRDIPSYSSGPVHFLSGLRRKGSSSRDKDQSGSGGYTATPTTGGGFAESLSSFISKHSPVISSGSSGRVKHDSGGGGGGGTGVSFSLKRAGSGKGTEHSSTTVTPPSLSSSSLVMQKSKSSSSVFHGEKRGSTSSTGGGLSTIGASASSSGSRLMSKTRIFKSRSKSTGRSSTPACSWSPQGNGRWTSSSGQQVDLQDTPLGNLSDKEAEVLQKLSQLKLQTLTPGVEIKIPKDKPLANHKPKRRPYVLKKKALSTGFFDSPNSKDDSAGGGGRVFGISLSQCIQNDKDRAVKTASTAGRARQSIVGYFDHHPGDAKRTDNGSRNSLSSVHESSLAKEKGSTESLFGSSGAGLAHSGDPRNIPTTGGGAIPLFLTQSLAFLEAHALHTIGIFRVSPSLKRVRQLREEIDGGWSEFEFGEDHTVHDIAALVKEFLRDLPEPLLTHELNPAFINTRVFQSNRKLQLEATQHLIKLLPPPNRDTLEALLRFLAKVAKNATDSVCPLTGEILKGNKMDSCNLATVIAPNFLPLSTGTSAEPSSLQTRDRRDSIDIIDFMISNFSDLFEVSAETLDEIYFRMLETDPEALEVVLKNKAGPEDPAFDEADNASSVFEGSEPGEPWDGDEVTRRVQRREDILHKDAGKGGNPEQKGFLLGRVDKSRTRKDGGHDGDYGEGDKLSGGESDGSTTKSRWFRRGRQDKSRTSSDSGSDKVKGKRRDSSLGEQKRASSLDSVSLKTTAAGSPLVLTEDVERKRSSSTQNLKVPELLNRRQSSPVLEGSGVITASLKIPVPLKLDDADIPYIEEEHLEGRLVLRHDDDTMPSGKVRAQIASTDTVIHSRGGTPSSHASTPPSSPGRHSSASLSIQPFSPPCGDEDTFHYGEEMTARFLIGPGQPFAPSPNPARTTTVVTQSKLNKLPASSTLRVLPVDTQLPCPSKLELDLPPTEPKSMGKETKGANIAGVIKSKTADFEKIAKQAQAPSVGPSIAQTLRLRSQGNIQLKQEFLLRQQQQNLSSRAGPAPTRSTSTERHRPLTRKKTDSQTSGPSGQSEAVGSTHLPHSQPQTPTRYKRSELISSRQIGDGAGVGKEKEQPH